MIVLNPFLDSLCNFGFKNIGLTPGIQKGCFQHPQDVVICLLSLIFDVRKCSFCYKTFAYYVTAKKHELIHTGEKSYACSEFVSEKKFKQ